MTTQNQDKTSPDKKTSEQGYLFDNVHLVFDALTVELTEIEKTIQAKHQGIDRLENQIMDLEGRRTKLRRALETLPAGDAPPIEVNAEIESALPPALPAETADNASLDLDVEEELEDEEIPEEEEAEEKEGSEEIELRLPRGPLIPEMLKAGDAIEILDAPMEGKFTVEKIEGPYYRAKVQVEENADPIEIETAGHYRIHVADINAQRTKEGKLYKNQEVVPINYLLAIDSKIVSVFKAGSLEIVKLSVDDKDMF